MSNLPMSLRLLATLDMHFDEARLLRVADACEKAGGSEIAN
jgi:Asp-tRNA(Asn)/Glu-tRNA(Gln) amidotransferase A subunit family amidase